MSRFNRLGGTFQFQRPFYTNLALAGSNRLFKLTIPDILDLTACVEVDSADSTNQEMLTNLDNASSNFASVVQYAMSSSGHVALPYTTQSEAPCSSTPTLHSHKAENDDDIPLPHLSFQPPTSSTPTGSPPKADFAHQQANSSTPPSESSTSGPSDNGLKIRLSADALDVHSPTKSQKNKKRARTEVAQADSNYSSDEEVGRETKKSKSILAHPAQDAVITASAPLQASGATRRLTMRIESLNAWFDSFQGQKPETIVLPNVSILADLCTDLHTIDLSLEFSAPEEISKMVSSLRYVAMLSRTRREKFSDSSDGPSALQRASEVQSGLLATVSLLYLLNNESFDRKYVNDDCLDESLNFASFAVSGFIHHLIDHAATFAHMTSDAPSTEEEDLADFLPRGKLAAKTSTKKVRKATPSKPRAKSAKASSALDSSSSRTSHASHGDKTHGSVDTIEANFVPTPLGPIVAHTMALLSESLEILTALTSKLSNMADVQVVRLQAISRLSLFAPGLVSLQSSALKLLRSLWIQYPSYRQSMVQDIFESVVDLEKGHNSPDNVRLGSLHIITGTLIRLLQANPEELSNTSSSDDSTGKWTVDEKKAKDSRTRISLLSRHFVKLIFDMILEHSDLKDDAYHAVMDCMVHDLTSIVFKPEYPTSELVLRDILTLLLLHLQSAYASSEQKVAATSSKLNERLRTSFGTWLSLIGTKLVSIKLYTITANMVTKQPKGDAESKLLFETGNCPLCTQSYAGKAMTSCSRCMRWFHVDCYGISPLAIDSKAEWHCDSCLVGYVSDMLEPHLASSDKPQSAISKSATPAKKSVKKESSSDAAQASTLEESNETSDLDVLNDLDTNSNADETSSEYRTRLQLIHSAMRVLLLNYMNGQDGPEVDDAKRFLIRQWKLESDVIEGGTMDLILSSQYPGTCPSVVAFPLGSDFNPSKKELDENSYLRQCASFAGERHNFENTVAKKIGLLPSRLGVQVFLTRFSMSSTYGNPSIFAYFPKVIDTFVAMLNSDLAKMRALSLRAITNMVEADMSILQDPSLYAAVEARLIDPSPMTREKALNMVGRFILMNPRVLPQYVLLIRDRLEDSSVSVRKRAVRIVRSICLTVPNSPNCVLLCVALAKRVTRQAEGIKDLALTFFREYWFADEAQKTQILANAKKDLFDAELPAADLSTSMTVTEDESDVDECGFSIYDRLSPHEKVDQILDVLQETMHIEADRDVAWFVELVALCAADNSPFLVEFMKLLVNFLSGVGEEAEREFERSRKCELLVEQHASDPQMRRAANAALAQNKEDVLKKKWVYSIALANLAHVVPNLVGEHFHQLCVLVAVHAPTPGSTTLEKKICEKILGVLAVIIPKIRYPSDETWMALLKDLSQLLRSHGMPVIAAAIKCAAAIARRTNPNWIRSLYSALAGQLRNYIKGSMAVASSAANGNRKSPNKLASNPAELSSQSIIRFLYTLGMLLKCFPLDAPSQFRERDLKTVEAIRAFRYGPCVEEVYNFIVYFWKSDDRDVKTSAVLTLGHLAPSSPGIFVRAVSEEILSSALAPSATEQLKAQAIKTIHEFLTEDAERMKSDPKTISSIVAVVASPSRSNAPRTLTPSRGSRKSRGDADTPSKKTGTGRARENLQARRIASFDSDEDSTLSDDNEHKSTTFDGEDADLDSLMNGHEHVDEMSSTSSSASSTTTVLNGKSGSGQGKSALKHVAVDTGLSSTIVEFYIKRVLTLGLDKSIAIRSAALNLVEQVLKMGLTHPAHCVPMLVALETDDILGDVAHRSLASLDIGRILNRIAIGIQTSFNFQKNVYRTPKAIRIASDSGASSYHSNVGRLYLLFAHTGKVPRNNFLAAAFGLFEQHADSANFDALFVTYLTLLLAQLPFTTQEEALFAIYQTNLCIASLGNSALTRLKKWYSTAESSPQSATQDTPNADSAGGAVKSVVRRAGAKTNLPVPPVKDLQDAIVAWHLLMLKKFLRAFYALSSERCRNFMPSDSSISPIPNPVTSVNVQEYLQKMDPTFDEFRVENEFWKKPEACRRIYTLLKRAIKTQEDDQVVNEKNRSRRKSTANGGVKAEIKAEAACESPRSTPSRTSSKVSTSTPKSAKSKAKSNGYYNAAKDGDFEM